MTTTQEPSAPDTSQSPRIPATTHVSLRTSLAAHALDRAAYRLARDVADDGTVWTPDGAIWPTRDELTVAFRDARREWIGAVDADGRAAQDAAEVTP